MFWMNLIEYLGKFEYIAQKGTVNLIVYWNHHVTTSLAWLRVVDNASPEWFSSDLATTGPVAFRASPIILFNSIPRNLPRSF